jgi:hypothetical protein
MGMSARRPHHRDRKAPPRKDDDGDDDDDDDDSRNGRVYHDGANRQVLGKVLSIVGKK